MPSTLECVTISDRQFTYEKPWDGEPLQLRPACPFIAFDTETEIIDSRVAVPRLALAAASNGQKHVLIHPDQVEAFILQHRHARFVFHNVAFDFWVIDRHLGNTGADDAKRAWWQICHEDRMHDTMLLDVLIRLARGRQGKNKSSDPDWLPSRNLAEVGENYSSLTITKDDPYRERYGEIIGKDWADVEEGFFSYAIKDPIVTYRAYQGLRNEAEVVMRENGYEPTVPEGNKYIIRPDAGRRFGLLTEAIQVKGAVALAHITRTGMSLDADQVALLSTKYRKRLQEITDTLVRDFPGVMKQGRNGELVLSKKTKNPGVNEKYLRQLLATTAAEVSKRANITISIPHTPTGEVSTAATKWAAHADLQPLFKLWSERETVGKLCEFFGNLIGGIIHPRYNLLLRTGRTSCTSPNIQQMPRQGGFRELFVASPGHLLLAIDYSFIELRTLAAICEASLGRSKLGETIRAGIDPHCYTAAMVLGLPLQEFMTWKGSKVVSSDPKVTQGEQFKRHRQSAKAINFGTPGGLGADSLVTYARSNFGVEMTRDQAAAMRARLITDVYPELNNNDGYLADDGMSSLASNLNTTLRECWKALDWDGTWNPVAVRTAQKIVKGNAKKADGTPYNADFVSRVWRSLNQLNRNGDPRLVELLESCEGSKELYRLLFDRSVATLTGRVRGGVEYTQSKNTPFQGLAADGAKLALWNLLEKGYRVVGFVHDEILVELPDQGGWVSRSACEEVKAIMCRAMEQVLGNVPVDAEYTVSSCWSKDAKLIVDGDKVIAWRPE